MQDAVIQTMNLKKSYGAAEAVRGINLSVPAGSIYAFLGRNGAGKTSTMKMLLGIVKPTSGEGRIFGKRIDRTSDSLEIRRRTRFVSEDKALYDYMTVKQMIDFTRPFFPKWRPDLEKKYLNIFELPLDRKVKALSKGMRTKLSLLLALACAPELLMLDEPTDGLDPAMIEDVLQALISLAASEGLTIFFSSHQIAEAEQIADHVCIINDGLIVVEAALDQLKEKCRRVNLVFEGEVPTGLDSIPGVERVKKDGRWISLFVKDKADDVVNQVRALGPLSVDVMPVSLKEIFLESVRQPDQASV